MRIVLIGSKGQVGSELVKVFSAGAYELIAVSRSELDCLDLEHVPSFLSQINPHIIINAAAYTAVDKAEEEASLAFRVNADFVEALAAYSQKKDIPLIHFSTDYVFDGRQTTAYTEEDLPNPQGVYAKSKWAGEQAIQRLASKYVILRVSWVFGLRGSNFVKTILKLASSRATLNIVADQHGKPTAAADIARVVLELIEVVQKPDFTGWGIYHYAGEEKTTWYDFASVFVSLAQKRCEGRSMAELIAVNSEAYPSLVKRPKNSMLNTDKIQSTLGIGCHSWRDYLPEIIEQVIQQEELL